MTIMACSIDACEKPILARGWCRAHYKRWHRRGDPTASGTPRGERAAVGEPLRYLYSFLDGPWPEGCVEWPYGKSSDGYGRVRKDGRMQSVHILACERLHGQRLDNYEAAHECGVRACINPLHLRWATSAENQADRLIHGTHGRGERSGTARLTSPEVLEIRRLSAEGWPYQKLAERFKVGLSTISDIVKRRSWAWLT